MQYPVNQWITQHLLKLLSWLCQTLTYVMDRIVFGESGETLPSSSSDWYLRVTYCDVTRLWITPVLGNVCSNWPIMISFIMHQKKTFIISSSSIKYFKACNVNWLSHPRNATPSSMLAVINWLSQPRNATLSSMLAVRPLSPSITVAYI